MKALYYIEGKYGTRAWERLDESTSEIGALLLLGNYTEAFGTGWKFRIKHRGKIL